MYLYGAPARANESGDIRETFHPADYGLPCGGGNSSEDKEAGSFLQGNARVGAPGFPMGGKADGLAPGFRRS